MSFNLKALEKHKEVPEWQVVFILFLDDTLSQVFVKK